MTIYGVSSGINSEELRNQIIEHNDFEEDNFELTPIYKFSKEISRKCTGWPRSALQLENY